MFYYLIDGDGAHVGVVMDLEKYDTLPARIIESWVNRKSMIEKQHGAVVVPLEADQAAYVLVKHFDPDELYDAMAEARNG